VAADRSDHLDDGEDGELEEIVELDDPYDLDGLTDPDDEGPVTALARWRRSSTTGAILTGIGLGLQQVFNPKKDEVAIVRAAPGENEDEDVVLHFDPDDPSKTWMEIRQKPDS
jgi:hypothetical protein